MIYVINSCEKKGLYISYHIAAVETVEEAIQYCKYMNKKYDDKIYFYDEVCVMRVWVPK